MSAEKRGPPANEGADDNTAEPKAPKVPRTEQGEEENWSVNKNVHVGIFPCVYPRKTHCEMFIVSEHVSKGATNNNNDGDDDDEELMFFDEFPQGDTPWSQIIQSAREVNKDRLSEQGLETLERELQRLGTKLKHGDIVNFSDYRLISAFVVYRLKPSDEPVLIKTYLEDGYGIPCDFSDAPIGYFSDVEEQLYYYTLPDCIWPGTVRYDMMMHEIAERRQNPVYQSHSSLEDGQRSVDLSKFPSGYVMIYEDGSKPGVNDFGCWFPLEDVKNDGLTEENLRGIRERFARRQLILHEMTSRVTRAIFRHHSVLPDLVVDLITEFIA